jgi:hypothetical protein
MFYKQERLQKPEYKEYGEYLGTYVSENELVRAHLFVRNGNVVPYVVFKPPHHVFTTVDNWLAEIDKIAREHGYSRVPIVYWWG